MLFVENRFYLFVCLLMKDYIKNKNLGINNLKFHGFYSFKIFYCMPLKIRNICRLDNAVLFNEFCLNFIISLKLLMIIRFK